MTAPRGAVTVLPVAVLDANVLYPQFLRDVAGYEHLEPQFHEVHRNDRHVAAAALAAGATLLVTWNRRDVPESALAPYGVRCVSPDELLIDLLTVDARTVIGALERHRVGLHRPPHDPAAYRRAFVDAGLRMAAQRLP